MKEFTDIPSALIQQWEREALSQKIPYTEFGNFLRMKERNYRQSLEDRKESPKVFANNARNKLTDYGNKVALETLLAIPLIERVCKFARFDFEELQRKLSRGFADAEQKVNFLFEREHWFMHLKGKMRDLRISKETLQSFGLDFKAAKSFYYQAI
jgi:hypothetical protein